MNTLYFVFMVIEAVVILFELRALMQSSSVDYYHKVTQAVVRLTEPLIRVMIEGTDINKMKKDAEELKNLIEKRLQ